MTSDVAKDAKQQRREAQRLWDDARGAYAAGDYATARRLDAEIVGMRIDAEVGDKAARELATFSLDPWVLRAGFATLALYVLAWVMALA